MRLPILGSAFGIFSFGITLAACGGDTPTHVRGENPPTTLPVPTPAPQQPTVRSFPPLSRPGVIYRRTTGSFIPGEQRYVIYDDGTFSLQYLRPDWGFFEYLGRYLRTDSLLTLNFNDADTTRPWQARRAFGPDSSLTVKYNLLMGLSDFEDGTYRLSTP